MTATCAHSAWCARNHAVDLADPHTHETAQTTIDGAGISGGQAVVQVSYRDGDPAPRLYVSAEAELSALGAAELRAAVTDALHLMMSVEPTQALAGAR